MPNVRYIWHTGPKNASNGKAIMEKAKFFLTYNYSTILNVRWYCSWMVKKKIYFLTREFLSSLIISLLFSLFLLSFSFALFSLQTQGSLRCPSLFDKLDASLSDDPLSPIVILTWHRCSDPFTNSLISDPFVWEWVWIKIFSIVQLFYSLTIFYHPIFSTL